MPHTKTNLNRLEFSQDEIKKISIAQNVALVAYLLLLIALMVNIVWLIPSRHFPTTLVLIVIAGPLLFPMRGLLNNKTYTYQWASFLSLAYFAHGISEMSAYPHLWYAGFMESLLALMMYLGCVISGRIFKKKYKAQLQHDEEQKDPSSEKRDSEV